MAATLLDITQDIEALDDLIASVNGDITDPTVEKAITDWLNELNDGLETKVDNYAALITILNSRAETRKAEANRLLARSKVDANTARFLQERLKLAFDVLEIKKLETDRYRVSVANNGGKKPLDIHGEVPPRYTRLVVETDKHKIRRHLEAGCELPFAILQDRGTRLSIR